MAGQLNQDANALAGDAAKTINDVLGSTVKALTRGWEGVL